MKYIKLLINNEHSFRSDIIIIRDYVGDDNCPFNFSDDCDDCIFKSQCVDWTFFALAEEIKNSNFKYNDDIKNQ